MHFPQPLPHPSVCSVAIYSYKLYLRSSIIGMCASSAASCGFPNRPEYTKKFIFSRFGMHSKKSTAEGAGSADLLIDLYASSALCFSKSAGK